MPISVNEFFPALPPFARRPLDFAEEEEEDNERDNDDLGPFFFLDGKGTNPMPSFGRVTENAGRYTCAASKAGVAGGTIPRVESAFALGIAFLWKGEDGREGFDLRDGFENAGRGGGGGR